MANLFEKPIAANPMSEFSGLPLDFIAKSLERRQQKYDIAKADLAAQEESLLGLKFLPGDRERHMEIQGEYDARLDKIVEDAGGDYSMIQGSLDRYKRDLSREMKFGELGAQGSAYTAAMTQSKKLSDMLTEGKISEWGMSKFNAGLQSHKTNRTDAGGWTTFSGYNPSTEMDPVKVMHDTIDEVVARDNSEGQPGRSRDRILTGIGNLFQTNPNINKSLQERFAGIPQDQNNPISYAQWRQSVIEGVVDAKEFQDRKEDANSSGNLSDTQLIGVQRPQNSKGINLMTGNSMIWAKKLIGATRESDAFIASQEGKDLIKALEYNSKTTMPTDPVARAAWIEELYEQDTRRNVPVSGDITSVKGAVVNGQLRTPEAQILNLKGDKVIWTFVALLALFSFMPVFSASSNLAFMNGGDGNTISYLLTHYPLR